MIKNIFFDIVLLTIWNINTSGQWIHCNGEYSKNVHIKKFIVTDTSLIAGCREGVIFYNEKNDSWDKKLLTGAIIDITEYNGKLYLINAANQIKVISSSNDITDIHFDLEKFDVKSITQILVYKDRLYVGGFKDVFYQSLGDSVWHKLNTEKNIAIPLDIKKLIGYRDKILVLSRNGIHVSNNGTTFSMLINSENILRFGSTLNSPPEPMVINSFKLKGLVCSEMSLYAYSGAEIFKSKDLVNWEKIEGFVEIMQLVPTCCDGIMMNTMAGLYHSFQKNIWEKMPSLIIENVVSGGPSVFCVYYNKIFGGVLYHDNNGIWQMSFNYLIKFK